MKYVSLRTTMLALALTVAGMHNTLAQNANSGEIKGTVTDTSNAVVAGASVKILNVETGVVATSVTNSDGIYDVPSVPPGNYTLTFSAPGFRDAVHSGILLHVGTIAVDASLSVGAASQEVVVNADVSQLQTEDSGQHTDFDTKAVQEIGRASCRERVSSPV